MFSLRVKFVTSLVILVIAASLLLSCTSSGSELPASIKIGACLDLTGSTSVYGESQKNGIELAVSEINSSNFLGKGKEIKIIFADAGATNDGAVAAMTSLLEQGVVGILGPTLSAQAIAADPLAQTKGIPVIAISNTIPGITEMGNFIFRCSLPESSVIDGTIKAAAEKYNVKKVGILWGVNEAFTAGGYQAFTAAISKYGLEIQTEKTFNLGDTDFKDQLSQIIAAQPDAICVSALVTEAIKITLQARELGYTSTIIGGNGFNTPSLISQAGTAVEGIMVGTAWNKNSPIPDNLDFIAAYEEMFGNKPDQFAAQAYTSVWLYATAIVQANSVEPVAIRDGLLTIHNLATPLGEFSFTANREPVHPSAVQIIQNGAFVILE
jgi:branched-chain amino acid transport system substrate-binding protein